MITSALFRAQKEQPGWVHCRAFSESKSRCSRRRFFSSLRLFSVSSAFLLRNCALCLMVARHESCSWACSLQDSDRLHCLRSLVTTSFHRRFCPPAVRLPSTGQTPEAAWVGGHWTSSRGVQENEDGDVGELMKSFAV